MLVLVFESVIIFIVGIILSSIFWKFYVKYVLTPRYQALINKVAAERVQLSRTTIKGQTLEHLVPWMSQFEYNPTDAKFLGAPIDMVIFDGLFKGNLEKIVFLETKTGKSGLTSRERQIKKAIQEGRVEFQLLRIKEMTNDTR